MTDDKPQRKPLTLPPNARNITREMRGKGQVFGLVGAPVPPQTPKPPSKPEDA